MASNQDGKISQVPFCIFKNNFIDLLLSVLGLHCHEGISLVVMSRGYTQVAVCGRFIAVTCLVAELGL